MVNSLLNDRIHRVMSQTSLGKGKGKPESDSLMSRSCVCNVHFEPEFAPLVEDGRKGVRTQQFLAYTLGNHLDCRKPKDHGGVIPLLSHVLNESLYLGESAALIQICGYIEADGLRCKEPEFPMACLIVFHLREHRGKSAFHT